MRAIQDNRAGAVFFYVELHRTNLPAAMRTPIAFERIASRVRRLEWRKNKVLDTLNRRHV